MRCVECHMRDGGKWVEADFVINGQSLCQRHSHVAITDPGKQASTYTWDTSDDMDAEPLLVPIGEAVGDDPNFRLLASLSATDLHNFEQRLMREAASLETTAMNMDLHSNDPTIESLTAAAEARGIRKVLGTLDSFKDCYR